MQRTTLASLVSDHRRLGSERALVVRQGLRQRSTSYGELAALSGRFASELARRRIGKGERVVIWGANTAEWVGAFFGCVLRGVIAVPLDAGGSIEFARRVMQEVTPALAVGDSALLNGAGASSGDCLRFEQFRESLPEQPDFAVEPGLAGDDALQIIFTSGTTAEPKGVVHTHENVLSSLRPIEREMAKYARYERWFHPLRMLHTLPLSHVFGQFMGLWIPPLIGAEVHFDERPVAVEAMARIRRERISLMATVPRVLELLKHALEREYPQLREWRRKARGRSALRRWWIFRQIHRRFGLNFWAFVCGGAALPAEVEQFWSELGFVLVQGYGMTETTALVSVNHPFRVARGTVGQVLPAREVRLSAAGEIEVRGAMVAGAVWRDGRIQRRASEWLATGDLAEMDARGNLRFRARAGGAIVTAGGLNIYPEDLEAALLQQPAIAQAAVVPHPVGNGTAPLAVVIPRADGDVAAAVAAANRELADFQQIRRWVVWPEPDFPRTSTGKPLVREIARRVAGMGAEVASDADALSLDSLGRVNLQAELEQRFGVRIDDAAIQAVASRADVDELVRTALNDERPSSAATGMRHRYSRWPWSWPAQVLRQVFDVAIGHPLTWLLAKPRVVARAELTGRKPLLLVANHVTAYDPALVLYALPASVRHRVAIAMSGEMLLAWRHRQGAKYAAWNPLAPLAYWLVTLFYNVFPLPQQSGFRESFLHAGEAMERGYHVLVFPEGRRSEGTLLPIKAGAGLLWTQLQCDLLPLYLGGLGELKQSGRWFRPGTVTIAAGPIVPAKAASSAAEGNRVIEAALHALERQWASAADHLAGASK